MGARSTVALGSALVLSVSLLLGCGGGNEVASGSTTPALSDAETLVGTDLLAPDGGVTASAALGSGDLPPDTSSTATVADEDMPPTT
jgi:hypothetical protein